jgi:hypothetical protein
MIRKDSLQFKKEIEEIDELIRQALEYDFLADKLYTQITTKIGTFDEAIENSTFQGGDANFLIWVKNRLDKICKMLVLVQSRERKSHIFNLEDLMHPTGDTYNEDNSIFLSREVKKKLKKILEEKYRIENE